MSAMHITMPRYFGPVTPCVLPFCVLPVFLAAMLYANLIFAKEIPAVNKDSVNIEQGEIIEWAKNVEPIDSVAKSPKAVGFSTEHTRRILTHAPWPTDTPQDPGNEYSGLQWAEALGQRLFNDPGLSASGTIACAHCHQTQNGFTDGRDVSQGAGVHVRNTQGLLDVALQRWFGWDGGADSLWAASLRPMLSSIEMAATVQSAARYLRENSYVSSSLSAAGLLDNPVELNDEELVVVAAKLIASYVRTLRSGETPFDRYVQAVVSGDEAAQANYSPQAKRGLTLFIGEGNCQACHYGPNFSNGEFHDTGRPFFTANGEVDSGRYGGILRARQDPYRLAGEFNGTAIEGDIRNTGSVKLSQANFGQWKTPSLRNLTLTAPYMHDGSLATLHDVVDAYANIDPERLHSDGEAILKPMAWNTSDIDALVAFLITLSAD